MTIHKKIIIPIVVFGLVFASFIALTSDDKTKFQDEKTNTKTEIQQLKQTEEDQLKVVEQVIPRDEDYYIEKETSEAGLARKADTEITEEKSKSLTLTWGENDMRRMELNRNKPDNYQQMVIQEFQNGKLSHVESCSQLNGYYLLYYGQVYGNQWDYSNNKEITDYLKGKMWAIGCEFKEQAELKAKIDFEKERVENATKKVMEELEEVYAEN